MIPITWHCENGKTMKTVKRSAVTEVRGEHRINELADHKGFLEQ